MAVFSISVPVQHRYEPFYLSTPKNMRHVESLNFLLRFKKYTKLVFLDIVKHAENIFIVLRYGMPQIAS